MLRDRLKRLLGKGAIPVWILVLSQWVYKLVDAVSNAVFVKDVASKYSRYFELLFTSPFVTVAGFLWLTYLLLRPEPQNRAAPLRYAPEVYVSHDFAISIDSGKSYRVEFPVRFAETPQFSVRPWCKEGKIEFTVATPDKTGFQLVTGQGYSQGVNGKGITLSYQVKGVLSH